MFSQEFKKFGADKRENMIIRDSNTKQAYLVGFGQGFIRANVLHSRSMSRDKGEGVSTQKEEDKDTTPDKWIREMAQISR